jgi:hypothetical protein
MLQGAAAAHPEMLADRFAAFVACLLDTQKMAAIGVPANGFDSDNLARQRIGNVDRPIFCFSDPVSPMP